MKTFFLYDFEDEEILAQFLEEAPEQVKEVFQLNR